MSEKISLNQVYGIQSNIPIYTYVDRSNLDARFKYYLSTQRHIVVYGVSKQGKSCLRRNILKEKDCVVVQCQPQMNREEILREILRQLNVALPAHTKLKESIPQRRH